MGGVGWGTMSPSEPAVVTLGWVGFVGAEALFYSPAVTTFRRILRDESVSGFDHTPYVVSVVNCILWVAYGSTTPGRFQPLLTNAVGGVAEVTYVVIFLRYAKTWACWRDMALALAFSAGVVLYALFMPFPRVAGERSTPSCLGLAAASVNIAMYAAPLKIARQVVQTRSTQFMPLGLTVGGLSCSVAWTVYAVLVGDVSIFIPNFAGDVLGFAQLAIYFAYCGDAQTKKRRPDDVVLGVPASQPTVAALADDEVKTDDGGLDELATPLV